MSGALRRCAPVYPDPVSRPAGRALYKGLNRLLTKLGYLELGIRGACAGFTASLW
jgi:hypothetical protein